MRISSCNALWLLLDCEADPLEDRQRVFKELMVKSREKMAGAGLWAVHCRSEAWRRECEVIRASGAIVEVYHMVAGLCEAYT